jgi:hypothetical protein
MTILKRLLSFEMNTENLISTSADPDSFITSLFSSPGVDLRSLTINTSNENADMIAMMLQGCRNAEKLNLSGRAHISPVISRISAICHQLIDLKLNYDRVVDSPATKTLLKSCCQLQSLTIFANFDVQAYENLALYGGNLLKRRLVGRVIYYTPSSPLNDRFKQSRKRAMVSVNFELDDFDVKILAKFLSCFGLIEELSLHLDSLQLPTCLDDAALIYASISR